MSIAAAADVVRTVLPNGLTVVARRDPLAEAVAIVTWVKAGYFDEDDRVSGIAHVLEHMYFKGTPRFGPGEIATATKACGGVLNASTIYDHTAYYAVVPADRFVEALDVQFDAYAHSVIDAGELAREIDVIVQEAQRKRDTPSAVTVESLYALLHDRHRIRRWRIGTEAGLRAFTRDDVLAFYRTHYVPSNTIVAVVGAIDPAAAIAAIADRHGTLAAGLAPRDRGPDETMPPGRRWHELAGDLTTTHVAIGWRAAPLTHPDAPALELAAGVLATGRASRYARLVRDRGLASSVAAWHATPDGLGMFVLYADAPPDRAPAALAALWTEVDALRRVGPEADELDRVRRLATVRRLRRRESVEAQAMALAGWEALGDPTFGDAWHAQLEGVTPDDVREAMARWCDPAHAAVVVQRPRTAPPLGPDASRGFAALDAAVRADADGATAVAPRVVSAAAPAVIVPRTAPAPVHVFETAHGVPVLVLRTPGAPMVHLGAALLGGSSVEAAADAGTAMVTARAMARATHALEAAALADVCERLGGGIAASVGADTMGWFLSVPADAAAQAATLLADVVCRPRLDDATIEIERVAALASAEQLRDDLAQWPRRLAAEAAWRGHPYGAPAAGTPASLASLTPAAVRAFHRAHVARGHAVLLLVGDVEPPHAAEMLAGAFDAWEYAPFAPLPPAPWPAATVQVAESRDKRQTGLALLFPGPARRDPDRAAAQVMAAVAGGLGGRIFEALRSRESLAYVVQIFAGDRRAGGYLGGYLGVAPSREDEARAGLLREFARLADEPPTREEIDRAVTAILGARAIRRQSGGARLSELLDAWLLGGGLDTLDDEPARLRAVSRDDIAALVARWCDPSRRVEGIVRGS